MLTRPEVEAIRNSDRTARDLAWDYDVTVDAIYKVKQGTITGSPVVGPEEIDWTEFQRYYDMCRDDDDLGFLVELTEKGAMRTFPDRIYKHRWKRRLRDTLISLDIDPPDHDRDVVAFIDELELTEMQSWLLRLRVEGYSYRDIMVLTGMSLRRVSTEVQWITNYVKQEFYNNGHT